MTCLTRHVVGSVVVTSHGVGKPRVGVGVHEAVSRRREPLQEGAHLIGPEGAVETDAEGLVAWETDTVMLETTVEVRGG